MSHNSQHQQTKEGGKMSVNLDRLGKKMALKKTREKCFNKGYFNICPLNDLSSTYRPIFFKYKHYKVLRRLHCINNSEMTLEQIHALKLAVDESTDSIINYKPWWKRVFSFGGEK
jgi:hypothetical protein